MRGKLLLPILCITFLFIGCSPPSYQLPIDYEKSLEPKTMDDLNEECQEFVEELDGLLIPYSPENDEAIKEIAMSDSLQDAFYMYAEDDYASMEIRAPSGALARVNFNYRTQDHFLRWEDKDELDYSFTVNISFNTSDGSIGVMFRSRNPDVEADRGYRYL